MHGERVLSAIPAGMTATSASNHTTASIGQRASNQKGFFNSRPVLHNPQDDFVR
jgi:hypothetical protein